MRSGFTPYVGVPTDQLKVMLAEIQEELFRRLGDQQQQQQQQPLLFEQTSWQTAPPKVTYANALGVVTPAPAPAPAAPAPVVPEKTQASNRYYVDEDGMKHFPVCKKKVCSEECDFVIDPTKFEDGWGPKFENTCTLIVWGVNSRTKWEESREEIISYLGKARTTSISVKGGNNYAFVTANSHEDAILAKINLKKVGYTVKFVCCNLPKEN